MKSIDKIGFEDFLANVVHSGISLYHNKLAIIDMCIFPDTEIIRRALPLKLDAFCIILVEKGELVINVDYQPHRVGKNGMLVLADRHIIQVISAIDFKGFNLVVDRKFLLGVVSDVRPSVSGKITALTTTPVFQLDNGEFMILRNNLERLRDNIHRNEHKFQLELVHNELADMIFEIWNILLFRLNNETQERKSTYREKVFANFLKLLLEHSRTEHEVAFYADKLCVTPVYLSRAIKYSIGKPAIKLIHEIVLSDAMTLLRKPDMSIQDVADALHFPDRDSFSKFFNKNANVWPGEFKKREQLGK